MNILISIIGHWPWISENSWGWRPAQTLLTTYWFKLEGISLFSYQTPLFGPPWQVPFEFPLYQAVSTIMANLSSINIQTASHITSLVIFYTSAIFLFLICNEYFPDIFIACAIFAVYIWFPFTFFYSNEILIDFMALTFALGFIYLAIKWFKKPTNISLGILAILFVSLGSLVKITTTPIIVIPFLLVFIRSLKDQGFTYKESLSFVNTHKTFLTFVILMAIIPLSLTFLWTNHADSIKLSNPFTVFLTSKNLKDWNYGTISQKLNLKYWWVFILNIKKYFFVGDSIFLVLISLGLTIKASNKVREIIISSLFGSMLTIFIFFNLYNQIQYYIAISAFMSILIGYGLSWIIKIIRRQNRVWLTLLFIIIFGSTVIYPCVEEFKEYRNIVNSYKVYFESGYIAIAQKARKNTPIDGYIISIQDTWIPIIALLSERKVFILHPDNRELFTCDIINGINYRTVVGSPDSSDAKKVLSCFNHYKQLDSGIFSVNQSP